MALLISLRCSFMIWYSVIRKLLLEIEITIFLLSLSRSTIYSVCEKLEFLQCTANGWILKIFSPMSASTIEITFCFQTFYSFSELLVELNSKLYIYLEIPVYSLLDAVFKFDVFFYLATNIWNLIKKNIFSHPCICMIYSAKARQSRKISHLHMLRLTYTNTNGVNINNNNTNKK